MKTKILILSCFISFGMNLMAQIPANPYYYFQTPQTCTGTPPTIYEISASVTNECGTQLIGYPFLVHYYNGASILKNYNANTGTKTLCSTSSVWGYSLVDIGAGSYVVKPGYTSETWRGTYVGLCCPVDSMPSNSPDPSVALGFGSSTPASYTYTGNFTAPNYAKATFTVTNPYAPVFTLQGKNIDMSHTELISKCGTSTTQIPIVNNTNTFGTTPSYKVTIYNSDANKTVGTIVYNGIWQSSLYPYLEQYYNSYVNGNYYIVELSVRSSCSTGSGSYVRGHFKYVIPSNPTAGFTINNTAVPATCTSPLQIYNCPSYTTTLSNTSNADATQFNIELQQSSSSCGTYTSVYNSGYLSTFPTDLKNLPGTNGTYLQTNPGFYKIILTTKNACGTVCTTPQTGYFNIANPPSSQNVTVVTKATTKSGQTITIGGCIVPQLTQYNYLDGTPTCGGANGYNFAMEHANVSNANDIGNQTTTNVSVGTGSSSYNVEFLLDKWTGTAWQSMNYVPGTGDIVAGATGTTTQQLAYLPEDNAANPNYDAILNATAGTIFRITTKVSNACGVYTNTQIIKKNTASLKRTANTVVHQEDKESNRNAFTVYPNPFKDKLSIALMPLKDDTYKTIEILDVNGKVIYTRFINADESFVEIDTHALPSGLFVYRVISENTMQTGKIIKE